jgi:hypothetical protein
VGFRSVQPLNGRIAGNDKIGIVAEALQAAIPNIAVNIIIGSRRQTKKTNVPYSSQHKANDDYMPPKSWRSEQLADRTEVHNARKGQKQHEVRAAPIGKIA